MNFKMYLYIILIALLVSCKGGDESLNEKLGIENQVTPTPVTPTTQFKVLKIVANGAGAQIEVFDESLNIGDTLSLKASLFDTQGNFLEDVPVTWSYTNSTFDNNDRTIESSGNRFVFNPNNAGVSSIRAIYNTTDSAVISNSDQTGTITVIDPAAPPVTTVFKVLKIVANGAGAQSEVFDESVNVNDTITIKASLFDTQGNFLEDVNVTWSYTNSQFDHNDRVIDGQNRFVFTPNNAGVSSIRAVYSSTDNSIIINSDQTGTITVIDPAAPSGLSDLRVFKIIKAGVGNQPQVDAEAMLVGDSHQMKAALFDLSGNYISDAPAIRSLSNLTFQTSNLVTAVDTISATFTPSRPGSVVINANYTGGNTNVISALDTTGIFTVTNIQVPDSVLLVDGNNQTATVNTNLSLPLRMKVLDEFMQPIQGVSVTWSVSQGSGAIIGTNPVFTDADGIAEVIVKTGTIAGGNENQFRATVTGSPSLTVDFSANATPGPQHTLAFTTQPALLFAGIAFGVQPTVQLRDEFGNLVSASGTVTMSIATGAQSLEGTTTASMTNGVASFTNLSYPQSEAGVILRASNGTVTGDSSPITIGASPPGACLLNDSDFVTADGGCQDNATGLVWSGISASTMTWHAAVWDSTFAGSPVADADDFGRSNDYSTVEAASCALTNGCDSAVGAYCKNLNEGGRTDWRLPTINELHIVYKGGSGATTHFQGNMNQNFWSSDSNTNAGYGQKARSINLSTGFSSTDESSGSYITKATAARVICTRGNRLPPSKLVFKSTAPTFMGINTNPFASFVLQITDSNNVKINAAGIQVQVDTNLGSVSGTTSVSTDRFGIATFSGFRLDTLGNHQLTFSSPGLTSLTRDIEVRPGMASDQHFCKTESLRFRSQNGGCHDTQLNVIWSKFSSTGDFSWHQIVWGGLNVPAGNIGPDVHDGVRTNDYDPANINGTDTSLVNYCKDMVQGGFSDWRPPTRDEVINVGSAGVAATHFDNTHAVFNRYFWTSTSNLANAAQAYAGSFFSGQYPGTFVTKTSSYWALCVRTP